MVFNGGDKQSLVQTDLTKFTAEEIVWRQSLTVETLIDVYKEDKNFGVSMWSIGRVIECMRDSANQLVSIRVKYQYDVSV